MTSPSALAALREALGSGSSLVRRACVLYAARLPPGDAVSLLVPLTADRDSVVASRATEALVHIVPPAALQATVGPLLRSPIGKVRLVSLGALLSSGAVDLDGVLRRAVRALGKMDPDGHASTLGHALEDPSPRVIRMACEALRGRAHLLDGSRLRSLLEAGSPRAATAVLGLLCEEGYWAGLEVALSAVRRDATAVRSTAVAQLTKLVAQQVYARPPNLEAIQRALDAAAGHLPIDLRRRLSGSVAAAQRMS